MSREIVLNSVAFRRNALWLAIAAFGSAAFPAAAADQIFLRLSGVDGTSTVKGHEREIEITSYSQAFRNGANFGFGGGGAGSGRTSCGDITVLKAIDKTSPDLIGHVVQGRHIRDGTISFRSGGDRPQDYYSVRLTDVIVDAIEQADPPGEAGLFERVSLKARQFRFAFRPLRPDGTLDAEIVFGWDCVSNSRL